MNVKDLGSLKGAGLPQAAEARLEQWRLRIRDLHERVLASDRSLQRVALQVAQQAEAGGAAPGPDLTPPPSPTQVVVTAGLGFVFIETDEPQFEQGRGYLRTLVYGARRTGEALPTFADAVRVHEFVGRIGSFPSATGTAWHLWLTWRSADGVESAVPAGGTNGLQATTGRIGTADLGDLVVTAGQLADGSITAAKVAGQAIDATKFANGIEPVAVVAAVPNARVTATVFNQADGKLYRWTGGAYVATVPAADLTGQVGTAQIADAALTAAKFAGGLRPVEIVSALPATGNFEGRMAYLSTDDKLYRHTGSAWVASVAAADLTGQVSTAQIADAALTTAKFAAGLAPVEIVTALPATANFEGRVVYLTTDDKLYRHNGSAWVASVAAADVTGQLTDAQIAAVGAAKLTGQIAGTQITDGAISTPKLAAAAVTSAAIAADAVTAAHIAVGAVTASELAAGAVTTAKLAVGAVTANELAAGAVVAGKVAAGAISTAELAAGAVTTAKLAAGAVTADTVAANAITGAKIAAGTISGTNLVAGAIGTNELAAGAVTAAKIAAGAVTANEIAAGTITGSRMAANTISGAHLVAGSIGTNELAANAVTAGKIAAGAVTASQVAAGAITTDKLLVTGRGRALNDDPACSDLSAWSIPQASVAVTTGAGAPVGTTVLRATNGTQIISRSFPVEAGKTYKVSLWARQVSGAGLLYVRLYCYNAAGSLISFQVTGLTPTSGPLEGLTVPGAWTRYAGLIVPGGGSVHAQVFLHVNWNTTGVTDVTDLRCEESVGSDLIVDGAIVAAKLAANAIAVGSAAIQNGAIVNAMLGDASVGTAKIADAAVTTAKVADLGVTNAKIANAAVTTAKIGDAQITAAKIVDASITTAKIADASITNAKITGDIQSDNFVAGSAGWRIRKADGSAEFAAASIRGKLTTSQLEVGSVTANAVTSQVNGGANLANVTDAQVILPPANNFALLTMNLNGGHCRVTVTWSGAVGVAKASAIAFVTCDCSIETLDESNGVIESYTSALNTPRWARASAPIVPNNISGAPNKVANLNFTLQFMLSGITGVRKFRLVLWNFQGVSTAGAPAAPGTTAVVSGQATIIAQEHRV